MTQLLQVIAQFYAMTLAGALLVLLGVGFYIFLLCLFPSSEPAPLVPESDDPLITNP